MKPLISETYDVGTLQDLGRASMQIIHDLKNQLNGLKLYATFLRKRMEKSERPADEVETIAKLIAGLERAATDMTGLVRYGRPLELRRQPHINLAKILASAMIGENGASSISFDADAALFEGEFDLAAMTEALQTITTGAHNMRDATDSGAPLIQLHLNEAGEERAALIEWRGVSATTPDVFGSFAGSEGVRMALAAKIIRAHGGKVEQEADALRVRLPLGDE